jgi:hypothetical protein
MIFNFKKVSAMLSSAVMLGASMGMAAAANYPNPFVTGGVANVAIVYGTGAGVSTLDTIQAGNIQSNLQSFMVSGGTTGTSVTGEVAELFSGGTKIYVNDSLNSVKNVLTKSDLPTVLATESFSGNVDATITQTIDIGSDPRITFKRQPTSSDDPTYALETSTSRANYIYNASVTFSKAVNFTHADSEGETIKLFGQTFTVGSATDSTKLVLLQSAEKLSLTSDDPTSDVIISGDTYTIELVSASDTAATIAVTDSSGSTESREIDEADSKKVNGITIAVTNADETNIRLSVSLVAGSEKVTITDGSSITYGESDTVMDGTHVEISGGPTATTSISFSVSAADSDSDAILSGGSFVDPIFKTFKIDFSGLNIVDDSSTREIIEFNPNSDDKMDIKFVEHRGHEKTITWAKNNTASMELMHNDDGKNITVMEMQPITYQEYVVVGNEDEGYLLKLSSVKNSTTGTSNDYVKFTDVFSGDVYETTWTADGVGTISIGGKSYAVTCAGASTITSEEYIVRLNYPDSTTAASQAVLFPTIQTQKGAKIAFYEPTTIDLNGWDGSTNDLTTIRLPDGDGYTDVTLALSEIEGFTVDSTSVNASGESKTVSIGQLTYNFTYSAANTTQVFLQTVGGVNINHPAAVIFEEKDDNSNYEALIVELETGASGDDGIGIDTVEDTWSNALANWDETLSSDSKILKRGDLYGSIITTDSSDSDQKTATISYPDEQIYAQLYVAEESASITAGSTSSGSTQLGEVLVKDTEVSSVSSKNLIIVGGSCINSAAATLLGGAYCGSSFTETTGVGSGEFLIKGFDGAYTAGKVALVVAGYNAADTVNAAKYLITQTVDTSKKYKGTSATSATLITTETA